MKFKYKRLFSLLAVMLVSGKAMAADQLFYGIDNYDVMVFALVLAVLFLFVAILVMSSAMYFLVSRDLKKVAVTDEEKAYEAEGGGWWQWFWQKFNAAKPVALEGDILMDHDYDGIKELDNDLPPWWKGLFYITIVFAFFYLGVYHWWTEDDAEPVSVVEYKAQMTEAEEAREVYLAQMANSIDETNVTLLDDESSINVGKDVFITNCKSCHGAAGEGGVGPNLTDEYWIHGGNVKDVFKTIKYGVIEKGMLAWESKMTPLQIQQVASFIGSLKGTNPPNGKEPQGEKYVPVVEEEASEADATEEATESAE